MTDQTPSTERVRDVYSGRHLPDWYSKEAVQGCEARFDAWLAARDREVAANALYALSAEITRMSLEIQESDLYAEDYWRGSVQSLTAVAQLAQDHADRIGAGDE